MITETQTNFLTTTFSSVGLPLSGRETASFLRYYELLIERNKVMNLTAITEYEDVVVKHFADSALLFSPENRAELAALGLPERPSVIDVGTGAGFPGLPLAIVRPEAEVYLMDALQKRVDFLQDVITVPELENTYAAHGRAEEGVAFPWPAGWDGDAEKDPVLREHFDLAVSRAVSDLSVLSEYCLPYVRVGGIFAAYKSADPAEELKRAEKAIGILGGEIAKVLEFSLPVTGDPRSIILIKKVRETPGKYPRKAGKPAKSPLK